MYRVWWWLVAIYSMVRWSCVIYRCYRVLLVLHSLSRSVLAIDKFGGVGDMRHIKRGWSQHRSDIGMRFHCEYYCGCWVTHSR